MSYNSEKIYCQVDPLYLLKDNTKPSVNVIFIIYTHYVCMSDDSEKIWTSFVFIFSRPSLIDELGRFDRAIVLELEESQLTSDLDRMILKFKKKYIFGLVY